MLKMSEVVEDKKAAQKYESMLKRAVAVLDEKLWNGEQTSVLVLPFVFPSAAYHFTFYFRQLLSF
jgi:hypothetical protein